MGILWSYICHRVTNSWNVLYLADSIRVALGIGNCIGRLLFGCHSSKSLWIYTLLVFIANILTHLLCNVGKSNWSWIFLVVLCFLFLIWVSNVTYKHTFYLFLFYIAGSYSNKCHSGWIKEVLPWQIFWNWFVIKLLVTWCCLSQIFQTSLLLNLWNDLSKSFWIWILLRTVSKFRKRKQKLWFLVPHKMSNFRIFDVVDIRLKCVKNWAFLWVQLYMYLGCRFFGSFSLR